VTQKFIHIEKHNIKKYESSPENMGMLPTMVNRTVKNNHLKFLRVTMDVNIRKLVVPVLN
jgi:hypothetical protein